MSARSTVQTVGTPAQRFRPMIEEAMAAGVDLSQQVLRLTYSDSAKLRRDRAIAEDEISFADGQMVFIGVRVVEGAPVSVLEDVEGGVITPEPPPVTAMAKGQKKSNKEVRKPKAEKAKPAPAGRDFTTPPAKAR